MMTHQKRMKYSMFVAVLFITILISSCASPNVPTAAPESEQPIDNNNNQGSDDPLTETNFIASLEENGASIETLGTIEQPFFSVSGEIFQVDGQEVQVFRYVDESAREKESASISPDGSEIGTSLVTWVDQPNIWASGDLIVVYIGSEEELIENISNSLGEPVTESSSPPEDNISDTDLPVPVMAALQDLADKLDVSTEIIEIIDMENVSWPDSCLGDSVGNQPCLQVITPGYRIILRANGQDYEYHTDVSGQNIRLISGTFSNKKPGFDSDKPIALLSAMSFLTDSTGVPVADIQVISIEEVEWSNSCLGLAESGEMCTASVVLGWKILLEADGVEYELHSDHSGENIRQK